MIIAVCFGMFLMASLVFAGPLLRKVIDSDVELDKDIKDVLDLHNISAVDFTVDKGDDYWLVSITADNFNSPNNQIKAWRPDCLNETDLGEGETQCEEWGTYDFTDQEMEDKAQALVDAKLERVGIGLKTRDDTAEVVPYAEGRKTLKEFRAVPKEI